MFAELLKFIGQNQLLQNQNYKLVIKKQAVNPTDNNILKYFIL